MSRDKFLKGALILTIAGIIVKLIGSVNRIFLSRLLGGEGIGLYQMAYPIYLLALSISSAGIPVAISIIVAEKLAKSDYHGANRVFRVSLSVLAITGFIFSFLLYFGAGWLIEHHFVRDTRAYYAIAALAPAIFFVTILSSFRGYFQGFQMMTPTAVSQIAEQFVRVVTMVAFAYMLLPRGLEFAAAGASFGAGPGAFAGLCVLLYFYWRHRSFFSKKQQEQVCFSDETGLHIMARIIRLALPVSLANIMLPIVSNIDLLIVPARLEVAGYSVEQATKLFGYLTGMALPLVNLSTIPTASLAASIVPSISEAFALGDKNSIYSRAVTALRIANLITIPSFVGMWLLAEPISQLLYGTLEAGVSISIMSAGIVLLGMHQVTTGILQGLGRTAIPVMNMAVSAVVKIALAWFLTALPELGIKGAGWASIVDFGLAASLNVYFVYRYIGFSLDIKNILRIIIAVAIMGVSVLFTYDLVMTYLVRNSIATLVSIMTGVIVYLVVLLLIGGIVERDLARIPRIGNTLVLLFKKIGLLRR